MAFGINVPNFYVLNDIKYITDNAFAKNKLNLQGFVVLEYLTYSSGKQIMEPILVKLSQKFKTQINHFWYNANATSYVNEVFNAFIFPCYLLSKMRHFTIEWKDLCLLTSLLHGWNHVSIQKQKKYETNYQITLEWIK